MLLIRRSWRYLCGVFLVCLLGILPAFAQEQQDNFIIIRAYSGPVVINSSLEALYQNNRLFVPATYFSEDVDVPITYDSNQNRLTGWLENESNTVLIDFEKNTGRVGKDMFDFTADDYLYYEDELYVSINLVDQILNTLSEFDFASQSLKVTTAGNLPFDLELSRRQKQKRFDQVAKEKEAARQQALNKDVYMQKNWLQPPFLDLSARYSLSKNKGQSTAESLSYSANATFLTGGFDSEFNAYSSSTDDSPVLTFKTAREDETGHILGLFKHLEMGDTYAYSNAANTSATAGRGIKMSTESALTPDNKTYTFRDTLPLGWQVELYRNGELLGYQNQSANGYYEFADIPLLLGKNKFKLVFYGPQGQTREKEEVIFFNGNILNRGKGRLRLNYIDKNRYLIQTREEPRSTMLGHNALIEAGYGLTDNLTFNVSAIADSLERYYEWPPQSSFRKDKEYIAGNLSLFAYGVFSSLGTVVDFENKAATLDYYGQTTLWDWDIMLENIYYGKAVMARNLFRATTIENETTVRLNKTLSLFNILALPFSYSFRHFTVVDEKDTQTEHVVSVSQSLPHNIYLNAQYQNYRYFSGMPSERLSLTANHVRGPWTIRGSTAYDFTYHRIPNVDFSIYRSITDRIKAGARYSYQSRNLSSSGAYESLYSANLSYLTKYGYISLEAGTSSWHNSYVFLGYNMSFLPDWRNRHVYATGSKLQGTGALSAFAFMDANGNGSFDEDEKILPGADVSVKPRTNVYDSHKQSEKGDVLLSHLTAYRTFDVDVDISGIEDTLSLLNTAGTRTVKLRPAQVAYLSFPIVGTGDIEGTVYRLDANGEQKPARGIIVNLYQGDTLVGNKISEFDGYYSFPQTPLGSYTVRLDPAQAADLEVQQQQPLEVVLSELEQLEVRDMVLTDIQAAQDSAEEHAQEAAHEQAQTVEQPALVPTSFAVAPVKVSAQKEPVLRPQPQPAVEPEKETVRAVSGREKGGRGTGKPERKERSWWEIIKKITREDVWFYRSFWQRIRGNH